MLILLIFSFHSDAIEAGAEPRYPLFFREKLGPPRTIAKEKGERKEKSRKRLEKCKFFGGRVEIPCKNAGLARSRAGKSAGTAMLRSLLGSGGGNGALKFWQMGRPYKSDPSTA